MLLEVGQDRADAVAVAEVVDVAAETEEAPLAAVVLALTLTLDDDEPDESVEPVEFRTPEM